jgi:hypothetical protein
MHTKVRAKARIRGTLCGLAVLLVVAALPAAAVGNDPPLPVPQVIDNGANPDHCVGLGGSVCFYQRIHGNWIHPDEYHPWFPGDPFWIEEQTNIRVDARSFVTERNQSEAVNGDWQIEGVINCYYWGPHDYRNERLAIRIAKGQGDATAELSVGPDGRTATFEATGTLLNPCIGGSFADRWHFTAKLVAGAQGDTGESVGCENSSTSRTWAAGPSTATFNWNGNNTTFTVAHNTATNIYRELRAKVPRC